MGVKQREIPNKAKRKISLGLPWQRTKRNVEGGGGCGMSKMEREGLGEGLHILNREKALKLSRVLRRKEKRKRRHL